MSEKTSSTTQIAVSATSSSTSSSTRSFYGESPPKRSRLHENKIDFRPAFKSIRENIVWFDGKLSKTLNNTNLKDIKEQTQPELVDDPAAPDRDSPLPLKNLGNTCYENSIIQCLFGLDMFMDNFECSMNQVKQLVVKTTQQDAKFEEHSDADDDHSAKTNSNLNVKTISEEDVRYRIANAFDNLYRCYTQKRIHNATIDLSIDKITPNNVQAVETIEKNEQRSTEVSSHQTTAIPLRNLSYSESPNYPCEGPSLPSTSDAATNLTPIALVSAQASHEQSEIENRLEELKSAVGERSSQFNSTHQQDASEFFYHVIDSIQEFYQSLDRSRDDNNPVTKAFELELDYLVICPKCHHRDKMEIGKVRTLHLALPQVASDGISTDLCRPEANDAPTPPNSDLGLDSPRHELADDRKSNPDEKENQALNNDSQYPENLSGSHENNPQLSSKSEETNHSDQTQKHLKRFTLSDALNNYFKEDVLECNCSQQGCDSKVKVKKCFIKKLPQVLFITLARYSYTGKKNLDEIEAPFELYVPLDEYKSPGRTTSADSSSDDNDKEYQLVAAVCHLGSSLYAGHYTSYVYNQNNSSWYSCDDDSITKVQEIDVRNDANKNGYCFFYAQKSSIHPKRQARVQHESIASTLPINQSSVNPISNITVDSSVVMTPESSPQSSPSPNHKSSDVEVDIHANCINSSKDIDDWN